MEFFVAVCALIPMLHTVSALVVFTPPPIDPNAVCVPSSYLPPGHICKTIFNDNVTNITVPYPLLDSGVGSPYTWGEQAVQDFLPFYATFAEKNDFCSDKIFTLLCFYYFPICIPGNNRGGTSVFPCKNTCMEVTDDEGECTRQLIKAQEEYGNEFEDKNRRGWPDQFKNCNSTYKLESGDTVDVFRNGGVCVDYRHSSSAPPNTYIPERPKPKIVKELACKTIIDQHLPDCKCSPRATISKSLFLNNPYNYSFECEITSKLTAYGREAINCTISEVFSVNCSEPVANVNESVLVLGVEDSEDCKEHCFSHVNVGDKYLIAGNYIKSDQCDLNLFFSTRVGKKKSALVLSSKRTKAKLRSALDKFTEQRCSKS